MSAISLVLDHLRSRERFIHEHAPASFDSAEQQERALLFLELQRNTLLMYTSCGWFFNDISGIEPVQILKYAGRAIDMMNELGLAVSARVDFSRFFLKRKAIELRLGNGADIYRRLVEPLCKARREECRWVRLQQLSIMVTSKRPE